MTKLYWPAAGRNKAVIADALATLMPDAQVFLEIASGSGEHIAHFAARWPTVRFLPTDLDQEHLASIDAWCAARENVERATRLDVAEPWPHLSHSVDVVFCANMIHIAPWQACEGLFAGARQLGAPNLITYGPYLRNDTQTAASNLRFDASLKNRDARWGIRRLDAVEELAQRYGFALDRVVEMPANNLTVFWRA